MVKFEVNKPFTVPLCVAVLKTPLGVDVIELSISSVKERSQQDLETGEWSDIYSPMYRVRLTGIVNSDRVQDTYDREFYLEYKHPHKNDTIKSILDYYITEYTEWYPNEVSRKIVRFDTKQQFIKRLLGISFRKEVER